MKKAFMTLVALMLAASTGTLARAQSNRDVNPAELTNFNRFLDGHPKLAQQLAADPSLTNNPQFVGHHPGLQGFLRNHPGVSEELHESPGQFMYREGHYEWSHGGGPVVAAPGTAAGPLARFDNGYLDQHPEVARQLGANPALADNPRFLADHPGLEGYLSNHPWVRQELQTHPERFMNDEWRQDDYGHSGTAPGPVGRFDNGYLDEHPQVARQLGHNPRLADNPQFLGDHPGLDQYLADHPQVRGELQRHPERFINGEWRYARHENGPHPMANTDHYLDQHPEVARQLQAQPGLVDNSRYLARHPGLNQFLRHHPAVRSAWRSHPYRYTQREDRYDSNH